MSDFVIMVSRLVLVEGVVLFLIAIIYNLVVHMGGGVKRLRRRLLLLKVIYTFTHTLINYIIFINFLKLEIPSIHLSLKFSI